MDSQEALKYFKLFSLVIIPTIFLIWNILNEIVVWKFWNLGNNPKYIKKWHQYDAILRTIVLPLGILAIGDFSKFSLKILFTFIVLYRPIFNLSFNYGRKREIFFKLPVKERINILLYLSPDASIDSVLIKINDWLTSFKWFKKYGFTEFFNFILIVLEFLIALTIWLLLWN